MKLEKMKLEKVLEHLKEDGFNPHENLYPLLEKVLEEQYYEDKTIVLETLTKLNNDMLEKFKKEGVDVNLASKGFMGRLRLQGQLMKKAFGSPARAKELGEMFYSTLYSLLDYDNELAKAKGDEKK